MKFSTVQPFLFPLASALTFYIKFDSVGQGLGRLAVLGLTTLNSTSVYIEKSPWEKEKRYDREETNSFLQLVILIKKGMKMTELLPMKGTHSP